MHVPTKFKENRPINKICVEWIQNMNKNLNGPLTCVVGVRIGII